MVLQLFKPRWLLLAEIVCLRQQLAVLQRTRKHPVLQDKDRRFWIAMSRLFSDWRRALIIAKPETVLRWHARGWRAYWRWKSRARIPGRRRIPLELRALIRRMAQENPLWGQVRIMAELLKLGYLVSPRTVKKYMRRPWNGQPSPGWKVFLKEHARDIWACDFLCVRTLSFQTLYVFFLIHHATREIVHIRVTRHPTAMWTGQQVVNACYDRDPSRYLIHDRDGIYGTEFWRRTRSLGIRQIRTPVRAPRANAIAERFAGTLRRECLDHVLIFNERHLQKTVVEFAAYYNTHRPHRSLELKPPRPGPETASPDSASAPLRIIAEPVLGGLHHVYKRAA
jgi:transposase InsO family protein